ncbi:MAG TPA: alcohol dehydrogenase catalytic domain-containing protein [Acidimicrobiales bacterium]|nr:alcohol dehydrogenase catalytic domain-containing protein [Acidimicrobiales bacterium]
MRALVYRDGPALAVEERPPPLPSAGEALLRVEACAICGTDLRIAAGGHRAYGNVNGSGRVPGHEVVGTVVERGAGCTAELGQRVFVAPNYGCGRCKACRAEMVNLCETPRAIGITEDGAFADYMLAPREIVAQGNLIPVEPGGDAAALALAEPLACAWRGSQACRIGPGDTVLVYGAGPIGLLHVGLARLAGAAGIVACDPNPARLPVAADWGASATCGTDEADLRAALAQVGGGAADAVIVAAPAPEAQRQALELAAPGGRVNFFAGLPRRGSGVELDTNLVHYKELVVTGTTASTNSSCRAALDLIGSGQLSTAALIGARLPLSSVLQGFELAAAGQMMKVVIQP